MSRYAAWARAEHREGTRIATTAFLGPVFLLLLPVLVVRGGCRLDHRLGLRALPFGPTWRMAGALLAAAGFGLGVASVEAQVSRARGTPLPVMPTHELLTDGPYQYCRNPMTLGAIVAYLGLAVAGRTISGTILVVVMGVGLVAYLKRLEEPELAERFGATYLRYRERTPFMVPCLPGHRTL